MKTTKKHFKIFKRECKKWIKFFSLTDYEIHFAHSDENVGDGNMANCYRSSNSRIARLSLCQTWGEDFICELNDENIRLSAFEEVCHVLLYGLSSCAYARFIMEHEINEAEHSLIRVLQNVIFKQQNKGE